MGLEKISVESVRVTLSNRTSHFPTKTMSFLSDFIMNNTGHAGRGEIFGVKGHRKLVKTYSFCGDDLRKDFWFFFI